MKKLFLLIFFILLAFILFNRQRFYVRDPLATVYRGDARQSGSEVYINYSNDVLLVTNGDHILLQHWNQIPGVPQHLTCMRWMACLADSEHAAIKPLAPARSYNPQVIMTNKEVSYCDPSGSTLRIALR